MYFKKLKRSPGLLKLCSYIKDKFKDMVVQENNRHSSHERQKEPRHSLSASITASHCLTLHCWLQTSSLDLGPLCVHAGTARLLSPPK